MQETFTGDLSGVLGHLNCSDLNVICSDLIVRGVDFLNLYFMGLLSKRLNLGYKLSAMSVSCL